MTVLTLAIFIIVFLSHSWTDPGVPPKASLNWPFSLSSTSLTCLKIRLEEEVHAVVCRTEASKTWKPPGEETELFICSLLYSLLKSKLTIGYGFLHFLWEARGPHG